ncbi:two pore domain potassium channel family protein [Secundilactobacillus kimchicus]|uniref:Potassium transport protein n=1 Tax=Secundilactobacillus kimchicus JCM 15530 TaxID=1302272 RepID=A0A0R1HUU7_9LACO|nr:potassium channel family protein [Secundilactobacillus kimchicus]KRK47572.1 potassium transport protein [Secundilactobacillus kimchicus JCM 15530]MBT9672244.1 two pore domain potassium channel family protein [Secundilactobacillus kimchicus]
MMKQKWLVSYHVLMTLMILASAGIAGLLLFKVQVPPGVRVANTVLWAIYTIDYVARLALVSNRKTFLIENALDLLGIIPMHPGFALFRLGRLLRIIRIHHLFYKLGIDGKWTRNFHRFMYDTGFIYLFSISIVIICISAWLFSIVERQSLPSALWWAVTTATTVGYGDDSPHTAWGKLIATALMFGGIGFIGLLTSTITEFFTKRAAQTKPSDPEMTALLQEVRALSKQVTQLQRQLNHSKKK